MKNESSTPINKNYAIVKYNRFFTWFSFFSIFSFTLISPGTISFKSGQKKYARVRDAYNEKEKALKELFESKKISWSNFSMLITAFKYEKELRVYVRSAGDKKFQLLKTYDFCVLSGMLGPKRKEGDGQVPEGLYEISKFNPVSNFHLSLKINYPNASDLILSDHVSPGGEIFIHGNCVSVGCIPITDELIKELYVLCVEAKNRGEQIPVYIFPFELTTERLNMFKALDWGGGVENLWDDLKPIYDEFTENHDIIRYTIDKKGRYHLR